MTAEEIVSAVLEGLRTDAEATMLAWSRTHGWPVDVGAGHRLFVSLDTSLTLVAGDHDDWAGTAMATDTGFTWIVIEAGPDARYKFTDGGDRWEADPWARAYTYDDFGEMSLIAPAGAHLERWRSVGDDAISPRTLRVWVPADAHDRVLYAHDGQNLFDPGAPWGGWRLQESAPAGMLVVGIDNSPARTDEYTHVEDIGDDGPMGGGGATYVAYVQETVRPFVRSEYGEPGPVGVMGSSLGGLISFYIAHLHPDDYAFAASLSGTMGWGRIGAESETMIEAYAAAGHRATALYLDSGGGGVTCADSDGDGIDDDDPDSTDSYCENAQMRDVLAEIGYVFDVDLWHWHEIEAPHNEAAWAERVFRPLEIFAGL